MSSFWGPLVVYGCIVLVGLVICAIGAGIAEDKRNESVGNGIAMFGLSIMGLGAFPAVIHLIGNCIEKCF